MIKQIEFNDIEGIEIGNAQNLDAATGCTVVLCKDGATAGVDVRGGAPGTRETDLLNPVNMVQKIHAVMLAGGSAFGLDAAAGVMRYLEDRGIGYDAGVARVPIVPAAVLFDLGIGDDPKIRPTADCGYRAAASASTGPVAEGNIGAGAGATVGKLAGQNRAMKSGVGSAALSLPDGLVVAALVAVNAAGDVVDPTTGRVVAGARTPDGRALADVRTLIRAGEAVAARPGQNTTIGVVATNARLTKSQATKVAQMAHDGLARAVAPVHTPLDGDTIFAVATGRYEQPVNLAAVGALAADAVAEAVVRAVRAAVSIPGYPAARDLGKK